jgi:Tol biopolymer transport system component
MGADGSNPKQLTYSSESSSQPFITPDGRHIVFTSFRENKPHIWRMDVDGTNLVQLTDGPGEDQPIVTPDGKDVIYTSFAYTTFSLWRVPLEGGTPSQLTNKHSVWGANSSPDGTLLAANLYDQDSPKPWQLGIFPAVGGDPIISFPDTPFRGLAQWAADGKSIWYLENANTSIRKQPIRGGSFVEILSLMPRERIYNFAFWPGGTELVISRGQPLSDVVLIEDAK